MWLFHLHSEVKIQPFSPVFPLAGSTRLRHFADYPFGTSRKKVSTIFITQPKKIISYAEPLIKRERLITYKMRRFCHRVWLPNFLQYSENDRLFLWFFRWWIHNRGILLVIPLKFQKNGSVRVHGCFVLAIYWKYMLFLQIFRWWALWLGDFIGYFLEAPKGWPAKMP